jgi:hypothetical protein
MNEYTFEVKLDGEKDSIKIFADSVFEAVDAIVLNEDIEDVYLVTEQTEKLFWDMSDFDLQYCRNVRKRANFEDDAEFNRILKRVKDEVGLDNLVPKGRKLQ